MQYIIESFYEYVYEPICQYFFQEIHYLIPNNSHRTIDISQDEIDKIIQEAVVEIKHDKQIKELQMRYINLNKETVVDYNEDDNNADDNNVDNNNDNDNYNAILVKKCVKS